jgi:hypothetical protein
LDQQRWRGQPPGLIRQFRQLAAIDAIEVDHYPAELPGGELHLEYVRSFGDEGELLGHQLLRPTVRVRFQR